MGSTWLALRADLRVRWRAMAGLALLLGLIGGVVLTAAAGARRTDTAYPRLLQWARAAQVIIVPTGNGLPSVYFTALGRLPQVAAMSTTGLYQAVLPTRRGQQLVPRGGHVQPRPRAGNLGRPGQDPGRAGRSARGRPGRP